MGVSVKKIFEMKNLDLFYGDFQALKNINLDVVNNQVLALIGPTGCGKSTFLRCLNRMNDLIDDVTKIKKLETMRSDFISNVTHE